jgi:serine/threonine protein kinase
MRSRRPVPKIRKTVRPPLLFSFSLLDTDSPAVVSYKWIKGDLIGRGTYGHVYIALSVTTGETIAVKQVEMPRTFSDKEDQRTKGMISSLKAEIELLKDLDHPNIVLYLGSSSFLRFRERDVADDSP